MTLFDRINETAQAHKQAAWAVYTPLTLEQLGKEIHTHDKAKEREPEDVVIVHRETELLAIKHALGRFSFMSEDPVIRMNPVVLTRYCMQCHKKHPITEFKFHSELDRFICVKRNVEKRRYYWRRSDEVTRGIAVFSM